jgi:acyl-CoA synthetase (AMP-forming)/AMP-acid ligase II
MNIADRLRQSAQLVPTQRAVVFPETRDRASRVAWTHLTFQQLDHEADAIARGLIDMGVRPCDRIVVMVRPSIEFIALTFGVFRSGAVCSLIDPGMGKKSVLKCLDEVDPDGFLAITPVHLVRRLMPWRYRRARFNVIVGPNKRRLGCVSYRELVESGRRLSIPLPQTRSTDAAAIIFTSGSTGPPKGVLYEHGMFDAQVDLIRNHYRPDPGEIDLPGFPLFALFNLAMQVTTVIPDMDPTRPAKVNPERILEAIRCQGVTQAYGSPALWNRVGRYCEQHAVQLPTLRRILSAGAPVPIHVLKRMTAALNDSADVFTPYGATECLPVASIGGRTVLNETAMLTAQGKGTCIGTIFDGMEVRIIATSFDPIAEISQTRELPQGEIGEIIVKGPVATREYFRRDDATQMAKIRDGDSFWHRMGDVGYFDNTRRLWFCGRKAHIVRSASGPMYSVCCEAIFNNHPRIYRSALVGVSSPPVKGSEPNQNQLPVIVVEPEDGAFPRTQSEKARLKEELLTLASANRLTASIRDLLFHRSLPVDTRHNVKINREALALWATTQH